mgnify:CR=1 FL=1
MIHLNYDGKQNNGIVFNDTYPNGAMYIGSEYKPTLSFEFDSFQYSEVFDALDYVLLDGVKKVMTYEQATEVVALATSWVQPIGQEGNPNNEQKVRQLESMIDPHIMKPITAYNELNGLRFASPQNCKDWMDDDTYEHQAFCISAWNYHKNVYLTIRAYQVSATVIPTDEEFQAVLDGIEF